MFSILDIQDNEPDYTAEEENENENENENEATENEDAESEEEEESMSAQPIRVSFTITKVRLLMNA
jgi:hypothetical protein